MELTPIDIDLLDRYFRNELTNDESLQLSKRMQENEFASEAKSYLETLEVVREAGREDLRIRLKLIKERVELEDGFEKYKSTTKGKGFGNSGIIISIFTVVIGLLIYLFYSESFKTKSIQQYFPDAETIDTVYHYNIQRDTIIVNNKDSIKKVNKPRITSDTIFIRSKVQPKDTVDSLRSNQFK